MENSTDLWNKMASTSLGPIIASASSTKLANLCRTNLALIPDSSPTVWMNAFEARHHEATKKNKNCWRIIAGRVPNRQGASRGGGKSDKVTYSSLTGEGREGPRASQKGKTREFLNSEARSV